MKSHGKLTARGRCLSPIYQRVLQPHCTRTVVLSHLCINAIFLPRQAQNNHRENSEKLSFSQAVGLPVGDEPQSVYALFDGRHYSTGCCFDYVSPTGRPLAAIHAIFELYIAR